MALPFSLHTAMETTPGDVNEAHEMVPLLESHHLNTGVKADTVVADSKYGTIENFLACASPRYGDVLSPLQMDPPYHPCL